MEALQRVLAQSTGDLARVLEDQMGMQEAAARRFVQVAGDELLASYRWQRAALDVERLADARTVRDLLSTVGAGRIAQDVGISRAEVWTGLRAFVPSVLEMAAGQPAGPAGRRNGHDPVWRRSRRAPVAAIGFLQPME